jgi:hypothetical protein
MPVFDWRESGVEADIGDWGAKRWDELAARYATAIGARGVDDWNAFVTEVREVAPQQLGPASEAVLRSSLDTLMTKLRSTPALKQPTVFVSHQRLDADWAEWAAWAATEAHFDYWLDVHDPNLTNASTLVLPAVIKSVLVAGIIEMALTNCTHLVSMQTKNAQNSRWIPYEFGRAKEYRSLATNAASWFEHGVTPTSNGDYLGLASCAFASADLRAWLNNAGRTPPPKPNKRWQRSLPTPLPN